MKVKFINELKSNDVIAQKISSIPEKNFEQFFDEIYPLLNVNGKIKRVEVEFARGGLSNDVTVTFYFFGRGIAGYIRFDIVHIIFALQATNYDESAIVNKWTEFLKNNLGADVYKKLVAAKTKTDLEWSENSIKMCENRVQKTMQELEEEKTTLKNWKTEQTQKVQKFKTDFADVLDENGEIVGL